MPSLSRQTGTVSAFWSHHDLDVLQVSGADSMTYLQGQISQDIANLAPGDAAYSFVLQPTGKVETLTRIHRTGPQTFVLDTDAGFGLALAARLNRFKIRVDVAIDTLAWRGIAVRGAPSRPPAALQAWGLDDAFDLVGEDVQAPAGLRQATQTELELARIEAGWPAMGREIIDTTIPAETGHLVALAVSFTKGCYPGQELVERMDSRGSAAPRLVRRLRGAGTATVGTEILHGAKVVGSITSVAVAGAGWVALASVARAVQAGDTVSVDGRAVVIENAAPATAEAARVESSAQ